MSEKSRRETFGRNFGKIQTDFHDFCRWLTRKLSLYLLRLPRHLNCVATLPDEIWKFKKQPISLTPLQLYIKTNFDLTYRAHTHLNDKCTTLILEIPNFLKTQCGIGGRKPPFQIPARFVQSFRYGLWQTDGQTDGRTHDDSIHRASIASCGKKNQVLKMSMSSKLQTRVYRRLQYVIHW